jgi:hypothetical protein
MTLFYVVLVLIVAIGIGFTWSTMAVTFVLRSVKDELRDVNDALKAIHDRLIEIRNGEGKPTEED